ncbi:auxin-responsive protein SAUR67-like [Vitis vinifera]|nr:auxin-responsive protein SAUR67-like [Vitis vinifera]|eukprot:XP_019071847.1 PREDICTED: auxin-responsive protein SAUR67-like [Vitis vinifera]
MKWRKANSMGRRRRRRISLPRRNRDSSDRDCKMAVAHKGHFVIHNILMELFKMSEEEFGLPAEGPITLPCDAVFMEYALSLVQQHAYEELLQKAPLISMITSRCLTHSLSPQNQKSQLALLPCF